MAIDIPLSLATPLILDGPDGSDSERLDRVLYTAGERPVDTSIPAMADPAANHHDPLVAARRDDVEEKHRRIVGFLEESGHDAVVLGRSDSVAWFTSGGDLRQDMCSEHASVLLFINRNCRAVIADNVQSARVFEEELAGLGFQLKERPWYDDPEGVVAELSHSKRVCTDNGLRGLDNEMPRLRDLRLSLTRLERQRMRELGRTLALAVEATCRNFQPGETEADIAGHLAHRLFREGAVPVDIRVAGDDRQARYRQPSFKSAPILRRATIAATARRHGVCTSLTRTVSIGPIDPEVRGDHGLAAMVDATCIFFSRPGEAVGSVFRRARRIYQKFNHPHEWTLDYQGSITGYAPRELILLPEGEFVLRSDMALRWNPSVGSARSEDTVVLDARGGFEVVTEAQHWPKLQVVVKDYPIPRPGILER